MNYQEVNFFEAYPEYKYLKPFNSIYNSKDDSLKAWYVFLYADLASPFYKLPEEERQEELEINFLKNKSYHKELEEAIRLYPEVVMPPAARTLAMWEQKLKERNKFLESTEYNEDTWEMLDKLMASYDKLWTAYNKAKEAYEAEEKEGTLRGGAQESLQDSGAI